MATYSMVLLPLVSSLTSIFLSLHRVLSFLYSASLLYCAFTAIVSVHVGANDMGMKKYRCNKDEFVGGHEKCVEMKSIGPIFLCSYFSVCVCVRILTLRSLCVAQYIILSHHRNDINGLHFSFFLHKHTI